MAEFALGLAIGAACGYFACLRDAKQDWRERMWDADRKADLKRRLDAARAARSGGCQASSWPETVCLHRRLPLRRAKTWRSMSPTNSLDTAIHLTSRTFLPYPC